MWFDLLFSHNTAIVNKVTLMDVCQLLTFLSCISRLSNAKAPFAQSITLVKPSTNTHHIGEINHSYFVTSINLRKTRTEGDEDELVHVDSIGDDVRRKYS